jgi:hypothetical protein
MNARNKEWVASSSRQEDLEEIMMDGILLDKVMAGWHPAEGERFLNPHAGKLVIFEDFYRRGFGLPAHPLLRKLLLYYGISLVHLNPNSILDLAIFINLCKAFLGIEPHFNLFCYFFHLKSFAGARLSMKLILCCGTVRQRSINQSCLVPPTRGGS